MVRKTMLELLIAASEVKLVELALESELDELAQENFSRRETRESNIESGLVPDKAVSGNQAKVVRSRGALEVNYGENERTMSSYGFDQGFVKGAILRVEEQAWRACHRPAVDVLSEKTGQ